MSTKTIHLLIVRMNIYLVILSRKYLGCMLLVVSI